MGWTLDFMRRTPDGMNGVMEFLIARCAEQFRAQGFHATGHPFRAQAVALLHAAGQERLRVRAVGRQQAVEQRQRSHAVHVVIPVEDHPLPARDRLVNPLDGDAHVGQPERVRQPA